MFVIVSTYRARVGEEDAVIALHEEWQRSQNLNVSFYHSWVLLRKIDEPREFISIAQFTNEQQAQAAKKALEKDAWYCRLVSLTEMGSVQVQCTTTWHWQ